MSDFWKLALSVKDIQWLDFKKIFSWRYLADSAVSLESPIIALLGYIFLLIIIVGIILTIILNRKNKKMPIYSTISGNIYNMSLWLGILGLLFVFSRFQGIYILSSRLLMFLNVLAILVWTGWIVYFSITKLPELKAQYKKAQEKSKYLPRKKVKKVRL